MKKETIEKIRKNATLNDDTIIGKYTYRVQQWTGNIVRCKTEDIGREWIDDNGSQFDAWETVAE
jgi:hypothetical protein